MKLKYKKWGIKSLNTDEFIFLVNSMSDNEYTQLGIEGRRFSVIPNITFNKLLKLDSFDSFMEKYENKMTEDLKQRLYDWKTVNDL